MVVETVRESRRTDDIHELRAAAGLTAPIREEKELIWSRISVPAARIGLRKRRESYYPLGPFVQAHFDPCPEKWVAGGPRAAKSLWQAMEGVTWIPHSDLIWLAAVDYKLSRKEFVYMMQGALSLGLTKPAMVSYPRDPHMPANFDTVTGCTVETITLADLGKVAMEPPDLIILCEPGLIQEFTEVTDRFLERLSERRGQLIGAGTLEEATDEWTQLIEGCLEWPNEYGAKAWSAPSWVNEVVYPGGRSDPAILKMEQRMGQDRFLQRCGGEPIQPRSLVFHGVWNPRVHIRRGVQYNPDLPVEVRVDPGYGADSYYVVEFVQWDDRKNPPQHYVIDEVAETGMFHDQIIGLCALKPYWNRITSGVLDPYAGKAHHFGAASPKEVWWNIAHVELRVRERPSIEDSIERMTALLATNSILFSPRCKRVIWEMGHWRRNKNTKKPSDKNCDGIKALCYGAADFYTRRTTHHGIRAMAYQWGEDEAF